MVRAYQEWRKAYAFYAVFGIIGALIAGILSLPFVETQWEAAGGVISVAVMFTLLVSAAWSGRQGEYAFSAPFRVWKERFVHVASTYLLFVLALVTGSILANVLLSLPLAGAVGADVAAAIVFAIFLYVAVRFSLAPFYALKYDWQEAVARSLDKTGKHFIGVLVVELFIVVLHAIFVALGPVVYLLAYIFFLAHFTNLALIELALSRR